MQYFSAKQAAQYLEVSDRTIRRWVQSGHLKARKKGGVFLISKRRLDDLKGQENRQADMDLSDSSAPLSSRSARGDTRAAKKRTSRQAQVSGNGSQILEKLADIADTLKRSQNAVVAYNDNPLVEELRQERERLSESNTKLLSLLLQAQQEKMVLESQVKMLEAPKKEAEEKLAQLKSDEEARKQELEKVRNHASQKEQALATKEKEVEELRQQLEREKKRTGWQRLWKLQ